MSKVWHIIAGLTVALSVLSATVIKVPGAAIAGWLVAFVTLIAWGIYAGKPGRR